MTATRRCQPSSDGSSCGACLSHAAYAEKSRPLYHDKRLHAEKNDLLYRGPSLRAEKTRRVYRRVPRKPARCTVWHP